MQQEFIKEVAGNEKDINEEIYWDYFKYENSSFLAKDLMRAKQAKNEKTVNNRGLIDLRDDINRKENPENENSKKVVEIVEKILYLINNKQVRELKCA